MAVQIPPSPEEVHATLASRNAEVEEQVRQAYSKTIQPRFPSGIALAAVGGFGRGELFPCSDVDLLLLVEFEQQMPPAREALSAFLQSLWDAGLRPSHSVHTVADCVTEHENNVGADHQPARQASAGWRFEAVRVARREICRVPGQARDRHRAATGESGGSAPRQVSEHGVSSGAEYQGRSRRSARHANGSLARGAGTQQRLSRALGGFRISRRRCGSVFTNRRAAIRTSSDSTRRKS